MNDEIHSRRKAFGSGAWATVQQFIALGSTALSGIILARTLSVADFGVFSYATSLASMGTTVVTAGLSALAIKVLVDDVSSQRRTMTALIVIREVFAVFTYIALLAISLTSGEPQTIAVTAVALSVLFARAFDASEIWFQSRAESQKSAPIRISVVLVMLAIRVIVAFTGADLTTFVLLYVIEAVIISALLLVRYLVADESPRLGVPEWHTPRALLGKSWILALSSVAAQINSRGDIIVLQALTGSVSVGLYSAAARLSEMMYFLPVVFMTATFPRLLQIRKKHGADSSNYRRELQSGYDRACWIGIGISLILVLVGPTALILLYGEEYRASGAVLQVHALALPFVFMAAVFSKWIIAENLLVASLMRHLLGAALNIGLNFVLVPPMGIIGSAWATVASYVVASFLSCFATKSTRAAGIQMCLALIAPIRYAHTRFRRK